MQRHMSTLHKETIEALSAQWSRSLRHQLILTNFDKKFGKQRIQEACNNLTLPNRSHEMLSDFQLR